MRPQAAISPYTDHTVLVAWRQGIAEASKTPDLKHRLRQREKELLPRFAEHYGKLKALPRRVRRSLQRQWRKSLAGIALLLLLGAAPALAATINVGGTCTLGRAITSANNDASRFCTPGSGADRIVLPANSTQTLTAVNNSVFGPTGLPVIRSVITIVGNNSTIRRAPNAPAFRILTVADTGNLTLQQTTVSGGKGVSPASFPGNVGAGVFINEGTAILVRSTVSGNSSLEGAGVGNFGGTLIVRYSTISANRSPSSRRYGGSGALGNFSPYGTAIVTNSTISGNSGGSLGAGVTNGSGCTLTLINSTISGNSARSVGGGVANADGSIETSRTLVSGNAAPSGAEVWDEEPGGITGGSFNLFGYRGLANTQAFYNFTPGATDITATANGNRPTRLSRILNTTLADNGGPTRTHAIPIFSPAVDAVTNVNTCPPPRRDQRGVRRPQDGNGDGGRACDIGSFERRPPTPDQRIDEQPAHDGQQ